MREYRLWIFLFFLISATAAADNITTEGGNISYGRLLDYTPSNYWAGVVGWMNTTAPANANAPIGLVNTVNATIYSTYANGSFSRQFMILTRLNTRPTLENLFTPTPADFEENGFFSNFSAFAGVNFTSIAESPKNTFCNPCTYTTCRIGNISLSCPYIILQKNTTMGVLKFKKGAISEPVFVTTIESKRGYNDSYFDFEYMVPKNETYYFYVYIMGGGGRPSLGWAYYGFPEKPAQPTLPLLNFTMEPVDIYITNEYPDGGGAPFLLHSTVELRALSCEAFWDLSNITTITLNNTTVSPNISLQGNIYVNLTAEKALTYNGSREGLLQCSGSYNESVLLFTAGNIHLTVIKPQLQMLGITLTAYSGNRTMEMLYITNNGTAKSANMTITFTGPYAKWVTVRAMPASVLPSSTAPVIIYITVPPDVKEGSYNIPFTLYEYDYAMSSGQITVEVKKAVVPQPPPVVTKPELNCLLVAMVILALIVAAIVFYKKLPRKERMELKDYLMPIMYSLLILLLFAILWLLVNWLLVNVAT